VDDSNNVFLAGLAGNNPPTGNTIGIVIYKSPDGGETWSKPDAIHESGADDKQWPATLNLRSSADGSLRRLEWPVRFPGCSPRAYPALRRL
jgi:hypothetical protein